MIEDLKSLVKGLRELLILKKIRFKDSNGKGFPKWKTVKLEEVCEVIMGQSPDSQAYNSEGNGLPLIQGNADIEHRTTRPRNFTSSITKICEVGDLILTVRAPVGSVAKSTHKACIGRGVCSIRVNETCNAEFIYQFLVNYEPKWISLEQGSTFTAVGGNEIRNLKINLPCREERIHIANFLSKADLKLKIEQSILGGYLTQKKYLLNTLFI